MPREEPGWTRAPAQRDCRYDNRWSVLYFRANVVEAQRAAAEMTRPVAYPHEYCEPTPLGWVLRTSYWTPTPFGLARVA